MVKPQDVDDLAANQMARDIVRKIEETLAYPGQIQVTVIRESRAVEYAR
jgi:ribonuclease Y